MFVVFTARVPFEYRGKDDFRVKLSEWIGRVFYDVLPEHGYEVREEQIYTAFQMASALTRRGVHLAEAGLGTGKTFAYLLAAVPYARCTRKPVVIAAASTALQEQLAGPNGDIETLSRLLDLNIDARMAKDPRQYVCEVKVDQLAGIRTGPARRELDELLTWAEETPRGERSEVPHVSDRLWGRVSWDETMPCETCPRRGYCKLIKARKQYRSATDLIVCDHDLFFRDLWSRDDRLDDGKRPLLPEYGAVIFDEGHQVLPAAAMSAGRQIAREEIDGMLAVIERIPQARVSLLSAALATERAAARFFGTLGDQTVRDEQSDRLPVRVDEKLLESAGAFRRALQALDFEFQNEEGLHTQSLPEGRLEAYEARLERAVAALGALCGVGGRATNESAGGGKEAATGAGRRGRDAIVWVDRSDGSFRAVPGDVRDPLQRTLFSRRIPVIFSSATLSAGGDFRYAERTLGLTNASSSTVGSPFDYDEQVVVYLPVECPSADGQTGRRARRAWATEQLVALLRLSEGRALVLVNSPAEVRRLRKSLANVSFPYSILWEDEADRGYAARRFREDVSSVLVGAGWWEGLDVPGEALSLVVIWQLPFPMRDPLIEAARQDAVHAGLDPVTAVDYPEMGLRLKQGCGRLIRTRHDRGVIAVLDAAVGTPWEPVVRSALPAGAKVVASLDDVALYPKRPVR